MKRSTVSIRRPFADVTQRCLRQPPASSSSGQLFPPAFQRGRLRPVSIADATASAAGGAYTVFYVCASPGNCRTRGVGCIAQVAAMKTDTGATRPDDQNQGGSGYPEPRGGRAGRLPSPAVPSMKLFDAELGEPLRRRGVPSKPLSFEGCEPCGPKASLVNRHAVEI